MIKPLFLHDCERCRYLGPFQAPGGPPYDLYVCANSLIARLGDEGSEYLSADTGMADRLHHPALIEAARRSEVKK